MTARILREQVPVDDQWHKMSHPGRVLHIDARNPSVVEFWFLDNEDPVMTHHYRVFGTGQPIDAPVLHVGTAVTAAGALVWHLCEMAMAQ